MVTLPHSAVNARVKVQGLDVAVEIVEEVITQPWPLRFVKAVADNQIVGRLVEDAQRHVVLRAMRRLAVSQSRNRARPS